MNFLQRRRARLLPRLQDLPGFDNETFIRTMGIIEEGISVLCADKSIAARTANQSTILG